jgi:hypothetical protein
MLAGLGVRIMVVLCVLLTASVALVAVLSLDKYRETLRRVVENRFGYVLQDVVRTTTLGLDLQLPLAEITSLQGALDRARAEHADLRYVEIFDAEGRILFSTDPTTVGDALPDAWIYQNTAPRAGSGGGGTRATSCWARRCARASTRWWAAWCSPTARSRSSGAWPACAGACSRSRRWSFPASRWRSRASSGCCSRARGGGWARSPAGSRARRTRRCRGASARRSSGPPSGARGVRGGGRGPGRAARPGGAAVRARERASTLGWFALRLQAAAIALMLLAAGPHRLPHLRAFEAALLPEFDREVESIGRGLGREIEQAVTAGVPFRRLHGMQPFLAEALKANHDLAAIEVRGEDGRTRYSAGVPAGGAEVQVPLASGGRLHLHLVPNFAGRELQGILIDVLIVMAVALLIAVEAMMVLFGQGLARPLVALDRRLLRVGNLNFRARLRLASEGELERVAKAYNGLTARLGRSVAALREEALDLKAGTLDRERVRRVDQALSRLGARAALPGDGPGEVVARAATTSCARRCSSSSSPRNRRAPSSRSTSTAWPSRSWASRRPP